MSFYLPNSFFCHWFLRFRTCQTHIFNKICHFYFKNSVGLRILSIKYNQFMKVYNTRKRCVINLSDFALEIHIFKNNCCFYCKNSVCLKCIWRLKLVRSNLLFEWNDLMFGCTTRYLSAKRWFLIKSYTYNGPLKGHIMIFDPISYIFFLFYMNRHH